MSVQLHTCKMSQRLNAKQVGIYRSRNGLLAITKWASSDHKVVIASNEMYKTSSVEVNNACNTQERGGVSLLVLTTFNFHHLIFFNLQYTYNFVQLTPTVHGIIFHLIQFHL